MILRDRLSRHTRLGCFAVGPATYSNFADACLASSVSNSRVTYHFNDEVYSALDWTAPIETSLPQLYRDRALQLRAKYDYLVLLFSGGSDSLNMLYAFLDNDIHIDEVITYYPSVLESTFNTRDLSYDNVFSEAYHVAVPLARELLKNTKTKFRTIDLCRVTETFLSCSSLVEGYRMSLGTGGTQSIGRMAMYMLDPVWKAVQESGRSVGCVRGSDKPNIHIDGLGRPYHVFGAFNNSGLIAQTDSEMNDRLEKSLYLEFFYWTPDLPLLLVKQCQILGNMLRQNAAFRHIVSNRSIYQELLKERIIAALYPYKAAAGRRIFTVIPGALTVDQDYYGWAHLSLSPSAMSVAREAFSEYAAALETADNLIVSKNGGNQNSSVSVLNSKRYYF